MKPKWTSLAAGLWGGTADTVDWPRLSQAALDRDALGPLDLKLVRALAARAGRSGDGALLAVLACLLSAVRAGGLRIPAEPEALAARLEAFLRGLHAGSVLVPSQEREHAGAAAPGNPAPGLPAGAVPDLPGLARALAEAFHQCRLSGAYAGILGGTGEFLPLLHVGRSLYFQKYQAAEALAGIRLAALLSAPDRPLEAASEGNILDTVLHRFPLRLGRGTDAPAMEFAPGQRSALSLGLRKRLLVVSGGPGTGKTSLVANLLRAAVRLPGLGAPPRIRLAAPTGRAAQRLTESLRASLGSIAYGGGGGLQGAEAEAGLDAGLAGLAGETLHRLLRYQPVRGEYFHRKGRPIPADLVVVDEASMIDIFALARLLDALEDGAGLVLLGDMDQLPSVDAGAVLADLVPGPADGPAIAGAAAEGAARAGAAHAGPLAGHLALLDRSHRSGTGILEVTREINAQRGDAALAAMAPPSPLEKGAAPWTVAFLAEGRKTIPGGGCRLLLPVPATAVPAPAAPAAGPLAAATPGPADYPRGLPDLLQSWIAFHYLGNPQAPSLYPGRTLAAPRRAAYVELVARLSAAALPGSDALAGVVPSAWVDDLDEAFAWLDQGRILTFTRKGWHGSLAVNRRLRESLAPAWDPHGGPPGSEGFNGAPILIQENAYAQDLFNGEMGLMLRIRGRYLAFFRKEEGYRLYPAPMLPRHELAFASTVHKAQGSEYDQVLIILPEAGNRLLFKETLYTAMTRARHFAGIYGPRETFLEAVGRRVARESGLREYLSCPGPA